MTRRGMQRAMTAAAATVLVLGATACESEKAGSDTSSQGTTGQETTGQEVPPTSPETRAGTETQPGPATETGAGTTDDAQSPAGRAGTVTIGGAGDILAHVGVWKNAQRNAGGRGYDFSPMFTDVKPLLEKPDVTFCHLETPLSLTNTNLSVPNTMVFNVPHQIADALKGAGFDGCDRVGNHVLDRGIKGVRETQQVLEKAGLKQQGPTPDATDGQTAVQYDANGFKVAHLAYGYTTSNAGGSNTNVPPGLDWFKYWQFPVITAQGILADAQKAKAAGADFVVVSMHWGVEYSSQASPEQRGIAKTLLESPDVDLILGTHVHVPQPCEKINGKYVVYGMGNFISNQGPASARSLKPATQDGMVVSARLTRGEDGRLTSTLTYQPTHVRLRDHHIELATPTQNPDAYKRVTWAMSQLGSACDAKPAS